MIKHFCDICGKEIDQRTERKNKQINNLKTEEAESLPELKVLRKIVTGDMMNYRGMDICNGCAKDLSAEVGDAIERLKHSFVAKEESPAKDEFLGFGDADDFSASDVDQTL